MSILVNSNTRLVVQGITGRDGGFHTQQMLEYGTAVVAGVTPGRGGQEVHGVPVFNTVRQVVEATGANTSIIYVPGRLAADTLDEAAEAVVAAARERGTRTGDPLAGGERGTGSE